ncbi:hypothetical protein CHI06_15075 [Bacillus sp. 7884-1]|nr:hypothetical protein CHI06_15075 [Bacillus sp. 7884-1]
MLIRQVWNIFRVKGNYIWNGPDFVFKNKYNQPILIQANTLGNNLQWHPAQVERTKSDCCVSTAL